MKLRDYTYNGVNVRASGRRPSSREDKKYERTVVVDGTEYLVHYGDPDMDMQRDNPERRENFLARHSCDTKTDPLAPGFWACLDWQRTNEKADSTGEDEDESPDKNPDKLEVEVVIQDDESEDDEPPMTEDEAQEDSPDMESDAQNENPEPVEEAEASTDPEPTSADEMDTEPDKNPDTESDIDDEDEEDEYEDELKAEPLISFSGAVKALGSGRVGGYLVVYGNEKRPDLTGDYFTKSTDFGLEDGDALPVYYAHGQDEVLGTRQIGRGTVKSDDVGLWFETQLKMADEYEQYIYQLAEKGKLGYSSGAAAHLVRRKMTGKAYAIQQWRIAEASLTPTPAEPLTRGVIPLKSLTAALPSLTNSTDMLEASPEGSIDPAGAAKSTAVANIQVRTLAGEETMTENTKPVESGNDEFKALSAQVEALTKVLESNRNPGFYSDTGGKTDSNIKNFGDFLMAVKRGDDKRLTSVYGTTKALALETGATGGYTVPTEFINQLLGTSEYVSPIVSRVRRFPVNSVSGELPVLNIYSAPTAGSGQDAKAGGTKASARAEGAAYTSTEPVFDQLVYRIGDSASGYVTMSREMAADAPFAAELLRVSIQRAVYSKLERDILLGTGVGEPLGILSNTSGLVQIAPDTDNVFVYADAVEMYSRFELAIEGQMQNAVWIAHPSMITDIYAFQTNTNGTQAVTDLQGGRVDQIIGMPIVYSQHLPIANTSGCVVLADLNAYALFTRGELYVEYSDQAAFSTGQVAWRFGWRLDGKPINRGVIAKSQPTSTYTASHFVSLND